MNLQTFLPQETRTSISKKYIFLDTCIFLDLATLKNKTDRQIFINLLRDIREAQSILLTIKPVAFEFYLGSGREELEVKRQYVTEVPDQVIDIRTFQSEIDEELIIQYGSYAKGNVSFVDFCLGAAAKKFAKSLVMTRNYKDFPRKIFECIGTTTILQSTNALTYCFYAYRGREAQQEDLITTSDIPF